MYDNVKKIDYSAFSRIYCRKLQYKKTGVKSCSTLKAENFQTRLMVNKPTFTFEEWRYFGRDNQLRRPCC